MENPPIAQFLQQLDPTVLLMILLPIAAMVGGWALRVACSVCSEDPPDFWHSVLAIVIICVANIVLRFWLRVTHFEPSLATQILAPLIITVLVVAMSVRTGFLSAFKITFVHGVLCGLIYCVVLVGKTWVV